MHNRQVLCALYVRKELSGVGSFVDDDTAGSEDVAPSGNVDLSSAASAVSAARGSQSPAGNEV